MALSAIIARVSMDDTEFRKGMNRLQAQAQKFQDIGDRLSIGLTAPLVAFGAQVVNSFGQFDSLRRGLDAVTGSSEATAERLKVLREIAKNPGIGFQEAIQGDIRLRAVGISAEQSAKILKEFANAIALTGGGAKELNSVTVQLGQLSAKGKVLAQDLKPIIEAAPAVGQALKNMFNTVDSESIQKALEGAGKNSQDFINDLLIQLEKTPRVTGGFKNAIENIKDSIFVFASSVGDSANRLFQLDTRLQNLSENIGGYAEKFKSLSDGQQRAIISTGVFTAAIGPVLSIFGRLQSTFVSFSKTFPTLGRLFAGLGAQLSSAFSVNTSGGFLVFIRSALSRIPQVAVAIGALTLAVRNFGNVANTVGDVVKYFQDLYKESVLVKEIVDAVVASFGRFGVLLDIFSKFSIELIENIFGTFKRSLGFLGEGIKSVLTGNFQDIPILFQIALNKSSKSWRDWFDDIWEYGKTRFLGFEESLNKKPLPFIGGGGRDPKRFTLLPKEIKPPDINTKANDVLTESLKKLNEEIRKSDALYKIYGSTYDIVNEKIAAYQKFIENVAGQSGPKANAEIQKAIDSIKQLQPGVDLFNPLEQITVDAQSLFNQLLKLDTLKTFTGVKESIDGIKNPLDDIRYEFQDIDRIAEGLNGFDAVAAKINALSRAFENGVISIGTYRSGLKELNTLQYQSQQFANNLAQAILNTNVSVASPLEVKAAVASLTDEINKQREILMDPSSTEAQKKAALAQIDLTRKQIQEERDKGNVLKQTAKVAYNAAREIIKARLAEAVASAIANSLSKLPFPANIIAAGLAAGATLGLFESFVPKLAKGGLAFGPTLAVVGDNRNAKNDPEVIAPLSKLKQILNDGGIGGGNIRIYGVLEGNDIRVSNQYATAYYGRLN